MILRDELSTLSYYHTHSLADHRDEDDTCGQRVLICSNSYQSLVNRAKSKVKVPRLYGLLPIRKFYASLGTLGARLREMSLQTPATNNQKRIMPGKVVD